MNDNYIAVAQEALNLQSPSKPVRGRESPGAFLGHLSSDTPSKCPKCGCGLRVASASERHNGASLVCRVCGEMI